MFIASLLCALVECKKRGLSKRSIYCKPRHTMIPTSRDGSYLHPQFVWVKRCGGTDGLRDRHTYICVSNRTRIITETVTTDLDTTSILEFEEHLECTMRPCSEETLQCDSGLKYNDLMCRCDRACERVSTKKTDQSRKGYISIKFMVIALVAEMALLLLMIFLVNVIRVYCPSKSRDSMIGQSKSRNSIINQSKPRDLIVDQSKVSIINQSNSSHSMIDQSKDSIINQSSSRDYLDQQCTENHANHL